MTEQSWCVSLSGFESELAEVRESLGLGDERVVHVGVAAVAPHGQVGVAQHHQVVREGAVQHHVLVHEPTAQHLRGGENGHAIGHVGDTQLWNPIYMMHIHMPPATPIPHLRPT